MLTTGHATAQSRYSFPPQFVAGATLLVERAAGLEAIPHPTGAQIAEHRAFIVGAVLQAASAIEASVTEVLMHGPEHHLGGGHANDSTVAFLAPIVETIDRSGGVLERWDLLLHLLGKPALNHSESAYQNADLLVGLRNELVHYRSTWGGSTKRKNLVAGFRSKNFTRPSFLAGTMNEFPLLLLGVDLGRWAARTAAEFIDAAYRQLGVASVLDAHRLPGADLELILPPRSFR